MYASAFWWLRLLVVLALPFAIVAGSYEVAAQFPGTVKLAFWEWFASAVFIASLVPTVLVFRQPVRFRWGRIAGVSFVTLLFVCSAFVMHIHATCEYISPYIGGVDSAETQIPGTQSVNAAAATQVGEC